jgi:diaminopimelate epimerase
MATKAEETLPFMKMHGLGNDFVVLDARHRPLSVSAALVCAIGDRRRGVGFDQLAVMEHRGEALYLTFYNPDGSLSAACGNATRCIARHVMDERGAMELTLFTERGELSARACPDGRTTVNMGQPQLDWHDIPLAEDQDTLNLPIEGNPVATGMGNPHMTFFVDDVDAIDLAKFGAAHEHHPLYPERTNVQVAQVTGPDRLRMRVWERGAGITLASGSSSCATAVAAVRRGLTGREVTLDLDGGTLEVAWREDGVWMTGPTMHVFSGDLTPQFLESLS